ncbi:FAD binding domain-containing protein [Dyella kyungheensis]|uniref:Xanthine dehydrogenase family protein subunit M n=1 Tax=Dyella kyungheensis TaxID=1242174 RepID=A0ABS2JWI9_9GAMM|nr:xanthine dehydrogenase family protein subunit M [Dyella kyungheensis]MBM7123371.1 xanthine dehydrogenase family protein subunit M [Dyella kyungheensis]
MQAFTYTRAKSIDHAIETSARASTAQQGAEIRFVAGGTTLIDLMKLDVERPVQVIDINRLPLSTIERDADGGYRIGALVRNADLANHPQIRQAYPVLSQALLSGASGQLRNMATTSGNLLQRTRCVYFRDVHSACNKRSPGSGCAALEGYHRNLAILGGSEHCIATNPSDMNVALMALGATVAIQGPKGKRDVPLADFFLLPGDTPQRETVMEPGDLITHVRLARAQPQAKSLYLKLRDRASYEFALASVAIVVGLEGGRIRDAAIAMGGVGTRPWRSAAAEQVLRDSAPGPAVFQKAAQAFLADAKPHPGNQFKLELARRCLLKALGDVTTTA